MLYKLWEGSWDDEAVRRDREARIFSDPTRIRKIAHRGEFLAVDGYHLCEPSPQRTPVLYQAGASGRGRAFAGRHAECVFISARDKPSAREAVRAIRAEVAAAGRDPQDVKVFIGIAAIPGRTQAEAEEKRAEYMRYASAEAGSRISPPRPASTSLSTASTSRSPTPQATPSSPPRPPPPSGG